MIHGFEQFKEIPLIIFPKVVKSQLPLCKRGIGTLRISFFELRENSTPPLQKGDRNHSDFYGVNEGDLSFRDREIILTSERFLPTSICPVKVR